MTADLSVPCRWCGNTNADATAHIYGERKCCPDCDHRPTEPQFIREVNEAVSWDDRKTLSDVWQEHARIDHLGDDTYSALIAVAQWGARTALQYADDESEPETVTVHEHQWFSDHTYADGPNRDPQVCIGGCGRTRVIVTECPDAPMDPDCRGGKHAACSGRAWDDDADALTDCACSCHTGATS